MNYSKTISLECPCCDTKCQFVQIDSSHKFCKSDELHHIAFVCTNCQGVITTKWSANTDNISNFENSPTGHFQRLDTYYPLVGDWKPRVNLSFITNGEVKIDFKEAINCYNNGFYNACMMMTR